MPEIRIGERVIERRREGDVIYYVEGVDHEWHHPGPGSTTLMLTHGEFTDENPLDIVYRQFSAPRVVPPCPLIEENSDSSLDEFLSQLSRGCRFRAPPTATIRAQDSTTQDALTDIDPTTGIARRTEYSFDDHVGDAQGLPAEGGTPVESFGPPADPEMIPPDDILNAQATQGALGLTLQSTPPMPTPVEGQGDVSLPQESLEAGEPINIPEDLDHPDPIHGLDVFDDPVYAPLPIR
jgi:hypothetical protein